MFLSDPFLGKHLFCEVRPNCSENPVLVLASRSFAVGVCPGDWSMAKH